MYYIQLLTRKALLILECDTKPDYNFSKLVVHLISYLNQRSPIMIDTLPARSFSRENSK